MHENSSLWYDEVIEWRSRIADPDIALIADAPPVVTFSVLNNVVPPDQTSMLAWSATGADTCEATGAWNGDRGISGTETVALCNTHRRFGLTTIALARAV
ncbi:MAG: hypothetical protein HKM24_03075 [Gammaproteobacteria bacterium]|nr:hypothetical protein [Gammaproteobacteria bacterium]